MYHADSKSGPISNVLKMSDGHTVLKRVISVAHNILTNVIVACICVKPIVSAVFGVSWERL